ncbi:hypothetical protein H3U53_04750 [Escherichia coli]|nr:hypothetical protein [Escherichia coli]
MLKQQDMTETARVVFNELSVTEPATAGSAQSAHTFHANAAGPAAAGGCMAGGDIRFDLFTGHALPQ